MSLKHRPGEVVDVLDQEYKPAGEVSIQLYLEDQRAYKVWWAYPQTGERELIKVPEWRLSRKPALTVNRIIR